MKPDQERVKVLLTETIALLCKNGLNFEKDIRVQGLLGITVDSKDVFIVQLNENLWSGEEDHTASNNDLPVFFPESTDISKSPRRRTGTVLADRDSLSAAAVTRSVSSDEKILDNLSDGSSRGKLRNDKLSSGEKRHVDKSETIGVATPAVDNIINNSPPVEIKTERLSTLDEDVVCIDDDDVGQRDDVDEYDIIAGTNFEKHRQNFNEHSQSYDDLKDFNGSYSRGPVSKRLRRTNSSSDRLFNTLSSTAMTSQEEGASIISETSCRVKLEIDPDGSSLSDERQFQGYDETYTGYPWEGGDGPSTDYTSTLTADSLYAFPSNSRSFSARNSGWYNERKRSNSSVGQKSLATGGRPRHPAVYSSSGTATCSSMFYASAGNSAFGAGRNTGVSVGGFGGSVPARFGFTRYKRFNVKTFVCQFADCGKTFCHSYHLYRHQREKHGCRYDNKMSRLTDIHLAAVNPMIPRLTDDVVVSINQSVSPVRQISSLGLNAGNSHLLPTEQISSLASAYATSLEEHQMMSLVSPEERKPDWGRCCFQPGCTHVLCGVAGLSGNQKTIKRDSTPP